mmetsp:Transcript_5861/g.13977  ORF Transcript_5861/g.13977 Transcript_5861/m.13977 type:complete len:208 (+) Transcript_5861:89-712(+)
MAVPEASGWENAVSSAAGPAVEKEAVPPPLSEAEKDALDELQDLLKLNLAAIASLSPGPAQILPHVLLGAATDAQDRQALKALGVTHVLNCAGGAVHTGAMFYKPVGIEYSQFNSEDTQGYDIMSHYSVLEKLADEAKATGGRLFVHCEAGVNRSGSLCLAYHALSTSTPLLLSAKHCKAARGRICTNCGFQKQVFEFVRARGGALA